MAEKSFNNTLEYKRLERVILRNTLFTQVERRDLLAPFFKNKENVSPALKLKLYELLLVLRGKIKRPFGLLIVLGWARDWNEKYAAVPDITQNIFGNHRFNIEEHSFRESFEKLKKTLDFDGAILISQDGTITASGVYLENMKPKEVARLLHPSRIEDLSAAFGFAKKVHTRHLTAIATSYILKGTTIFVLSEEDRSIRVLEKGKIIWSTINSEKPKIKLSKQL